MIKERSIKFTPNGIQDNRSLYGTKDINEMIDFIKNTYSTNDDTAFNFYKNNKDATIFGFSKDEYDNRMKYYVEYSDEHSGQILALVKKDNQYTNKKYILSKSMNHYRCYDTDNKFNINGRATSFYFRLNNQLKCWNEIERMAKKRNFDLVWSAWIKRIGKVILTTTKLTPTELTIYYRTIEDGLND
tara:strand:- start:2405 stop:2965 length:561 start_codon:yes stop_codon:yes gene_type:complete